MEQRPQAVPAQREAWSGRTVFILAAIGSAVGLGNIWRFPYIAYENGGGAFIVPYLIALLSAGIPLLFLDYAIGHKFRGSPPLAFRRLSRPAEALGWWQVGICFVIAVYYAVIIAWAARYAIFSFSEAWGDDPASFFASDFLQQDGESTFGLDFVPGVVIPLLLVWIGVIAILAFGVQKGIERIARLFLPVLFVILVLMLISALGMSGSREALGFIFRPNFAELEPTSLLEALGHSFFTLSLGMGAMITYGSYISRGQSIVKASAIIVVLDTLIALIATVIMFSVIFSVAGMADDVSDTGTVGMLFISLPALFYSEGPFGRILGPLFYVLVALAALTSTMSLLEVVASYIIDEHGVGRRKATLMCGGVVFVFTVLAAVSFGAVPFITNLEVGGALGDLLFGGKVGWFSMADHFVSNWMLPTGGLAVTLAAGWFMTRQATESELMDGTEPGWFRYGVWRFFIRFVAPVAVAAIIVAVIFFGVDFS